MNIIYKVEDHIFVVTVTNEALETMPLEEIAAQAIPDGVKYFIVDSTTFPDAPTESWDLSEDGVITVNQDKLIQIKRERMPQLKPMDFEIKLVNLGLYDQVQALIASDIKLRIAYNRATFFSRTDPFIEQARIVLNLTHDRLDEMWTGEFKL